MSVTRTASSRTTIVSRKPLPALPSQPSIRLTGVTPNARSSIFPANVAQKLYSMLGHRDPWADIPTTTISCHQVKSFMWLLSLPPSTPLLATKIASLGAPLSRHEGSLWPKDLCETHTWFEPRYMQQLTHHIGKELWNRSEGLYAFPKKDLGKDVRVMLYETLGTYRDIFPRSDGGDGYTGPEIIKSPYEAFSKPECLQQSCTACKLSLLFLDTKAVQALATLCKGRKRRGFAWPELLAFLEPVEKGRDPNWRRRWLKQGRDVRIERRKVRLWRERGGDKASAGKDDVGEECPILWSPTEDAKFEEKHRTAKRSENDTWEYSDCVMNVCDDLEDGSEERTIGEDDNASILLPMGEERVMDGREKAYLALHGIGVGKDTSDADIWFPQIAQMYARNYGK